MKNREKNVIRASSKEEEAELLRRREAKKNEALISYRRRQKDLENKNNDLETRTKRLAEE
jgi:hypothetical protein